MSIDDTHGRRGDRPARQPARPIPPASAAERMPDKTDRKLLATGVVGTIVVALCCFTPLLVVLLGVVGLSAALGWLDYVLLPALAFFIALTVYAIWRRRLHSRQDARQDARQNG